MNNLKKPFFGASVLLGICIIGFLFIEMVVVPYVLLKIVVGVIVIFICYSLAVSARRPVSDKSFVGITFLITGLIFMLAGKSLLREVLEAQYGPQVPVFLPMAISICGMLAALLSVLGLITNAISKKKQVGTHIQSKSLKGQ